MPPPKKQQRRANKTAAIERALQDAMLKKLVDDGKLARGNDPRFVLEWLSTGIPDLDAVLGGGIPRKRVSILVGAYSSAKSFIIQMVMKQALAQGLQVAYIDTERSYEPTWWAQVGIPLDKVYVAQPSHGEAAADLMVALARANVDVVAMDSMAALIPMEEADLEARADQKQYALQARLVGKLLRMLATVNTNSALIFSNQERELIGGPVPGLTMPGGKAPLHYSSIIMRLRREGWIKEKERNVGFYLRVVCNKNKVARPFGECKLPFRFRGEIDLLALLVDRAVEAGIIKQSGPWFSLAVAGQEQSCQGRNAVIELLRDNAELRGFVEKAIGGKE